LSFKINKPILYSFRRCPYAMRARMAIFIANIECELREVLLRDKPAQMLQLSPKGTVPVLQLKDRVIDESIEIIEWVLKNEQIFVDELNSDQEHETNTLINLFDGDFKFNLDRYKYSQRYEEQNPDQHRKICLDILSKIDDQIEGKYFFGDNIQKIDICILPFIRQFRIADIKWFDNLDQISNVKKYLNNFLNSDLLENIMHKYKKWEEGDSPQNFPYKPIES